PPLVAIASATDATLQHSTRMSTALTTTTMVSLGDLSAVDTGSFTAFGLASSSTPEALESRKKIRMVNTSISETRFMSTIVLLRDLRSARRCSGVNGIARPSAFDDRRVADRDVREQLGAYEPRPLRDHRAAHRVHHLHQRVVRRVRLGEHAGVELVGELALQLDHQ